MDLTNPTVIFGVRQFHVSNECSEAQEENNHPCAKKKKIEKEKENTNLYSVLANRTAPARCTDVFNCYSEARAGSC